MLIGILQQEVEFLVGTFVGYVNPGPASSRTRMRSGRWMRLFTRHRYLKAEVVGLGRGSARMCTRCQPAELHWRVVVLPSTPFSDEGEHLGRRCGQYAIVHGKQREFQAIGSVRLVKMLPR
jgi:hypothetical protein